MKRKKANKITLLIICIAVLAAIATIGGVYSKYVGQWNDRQCIEPSQFVFTSDYLKENGAEYTIYADRITFHIQNYDVFDNVSASDIAYTISVDNSGGLESTGDKTITTEERSESYTLKGTQGKTYEVKAISSSPFEHTIHAKFTFKTVGNTTTVKRGDVTSTHMVVHLYTGSDVTADTEFTFVSDGPGEVVPDNANPLMRDWSSFDLDAAENGCKLSGLSPDAHYQLIFFFKKGKLDPQVNFNALQKQITIQSISDT